VSIIRDFLLDLDEGGNKIARFLLWLDELLCWHQYTPWLSDKGWHEDSSWEHAGQYYCIHCGKWKYD